MFKAIVNELLLSLCIAVLLFFILKLIVRKKDFKINEEKEFEIPGFNFFLSIFQVSAAPSTQTFLTIFGTLTLCMGISLYLKMPFLIIAVVSGFLLANYHSFDLFDSLKISNIMQILNLFFFAFIGAIIEIDRIKLIDLKYILFYIAGRMIGKIIGTWCGCVLADQDTKIKKILPLMLLPQAGVPAIEAIYLYLLFGKTGEKIFNIILPSIIFFEIVGIILTEYSLKKWKLWIVGVEKIFKKQNILKIDTYPLKKILNKKLIKVPLISRTKMSVIYELLDLFRKEGVIKEIETLHKEIMEREKLSSTGFGYGIAVPHIRTNLVDKVAICCGITISGEKIEFDAIDKQPCNIFFMILSPENEPTAHLTMLSIISYILNQPKTREKISQFTTPEELYNFLRSL
ncbi:MAG TPA: PTS sugar transporter subunit IIA [bacterium]|nr:PTS sugar transporter subunit IIA [bacterium]